MKKRIFIVAPQYDDVIHHVCRTRSRLPLLEIYWSDLCQTVSTVTTMGRAMGIAKRLGAKRPAII
jgi:hypothetical protein